MIEIMGWGSLDQSSKFIIRPITELVVLAQLRLVDLFDDVLSLSSKKTTWFTHLTARCGELR